MSSYVQGWIIIDTRVGIIRRIKNYLHNNSTYPYSPSIYITFYIWWYIQSLSWCRRLCDQWKKKLVNQILKNRVQVYILLIIMPSAIENLKVALSPKYNLFLLGNGLLDCGLSERVEKGWDIKRIWKFRRERACVCTVRYCNENGNK